MNFGRWKAAASVLAVGAVVCGVVQVIPGGSSAAGAPAAVAASAAVEDTVVPGAVSDAAGDRVIVDQLQFWFVTAAATSRSQFWVTGKSPYSNIKALQYLLLAWGYYTPTTGKYDATTVANIKKFQRRMHLVVDGIAGPITMAAITPRSTGYGARNRNTVKAIQQLLVKFGYRLAVDGSFGPQTRADVIHFEKSSRILANGIVGAQTWSWLFNPPSTSSKPASKPTPEPKPAPKPTDAPSSNCSSVHAGVTKSHTAVASHGIRVNTCLLSRVNAMVSAASKSGVYLSANSSWRDPAFQIRLRQQNCGTSYYDVYQKPSTRCHPATAIPGTSRHERGLAVDFANCSRGSKVFNWLGKHAAHYGLYNLKVTGPAAESWHWSTDGH